ncbi:hypothetical protein BZL30_8583 [Mycobacterium kansasii]|uniref:Uncharacterized protein n=1 Tax=Mycobacterium kansasii TaxID=1768 RepID=A0A1V3WF63_MYCKA|nr:hypothetical protein BZL30_8583 [Mycobacterium kansasii]
MPEPTVGDQDKAGAFLASPTTVPIRKPNRRPFGGAVHYGRW